MIDQRFPQPLGAVAAVLATPVRPVVLIDGGAGAGKTTLAGDLADVWPGVRPVIIGLDDLYPGWDGLDAGAAAVHQDILHPDHPGYWRWDWETSRRDAWVPVDAHCALIIEGCGALTERNRASATAGIWVQADAEDRRRRALSRDGEVFAAHWDQWATQERRHWRQNHPHNLADWVWNGRGFTPGLGANV